ncbi:hypothetical protein DRJ17_01210 [Candidatus Woesearchaeota archaeon]|nr:MAG: hypothetical protein DRJ17_01210 [Candidatus Woesearchaeota archaeon]
MKVQLIQPAVNKKYSRILSSGTIQPIGLISLATFLHKNLPEIDVEVFDGEVTPEEEIEKCIDGDIVGVGSTLVTHDNALRIAEIAKEKGATTIMGGKNASVLAENILRNRPYIDYVISGDGELALLDLVKGISPLSIPGVIYRTNSIPVRNDEQFVDFREIPFPNLDFTDMSKYFKIYRAKHPHRAHDGMIGIYSQKGCEWREKTRGCDFCGRLEYKTQQKDQKELWEYYSALRSLYGSDIIFFIWF